MFFLELTTRHFTFHAFGSSRREAYALLRRGVEHHLREYQPHMTRAEARHAAIDLYSDDDVQEVKIEPGQFLRDYDHVPLEVDR